MVRIDKARGRFHRRSNLSSDSSTRQRSSSSAAQSASYDRERRTDGNFSRPEAVKNGLEYVYAETKKPILITENGIDTENDARRVWYIKGALASLHEAIANGIPVLGYFHWSLMDNFEWDQGFKVKYGLCSVDRRHSSAPRSQVQPSSVTLHGEMQSEMPSHGKRRSHLHPEAPFRTGLP